MSSSGLRERVAKTDTRGVVGETPKRPTKVGDKKPASIGVLDVLRLVAGLVLLNFMLSYFITKDLTWGFKPWYLKPEAVIRYLKGPVSLTDAELLQFDGSDPTKPIYLAMNGTIYDVTAGRRLYGPGGSYHVLVGKDAARAFITGCFAEDAYPDLRGVEWMYVSADIPNPDFPQPGDKEKESPHMKSRRAAEVQKAKKQVAATLEGWAKTFRGETGKDYFEAGKVERNPDWIKMFPRRKLCAQAEKARPKPSGQAAAAGETR